jgi:hypothetical protein
MTKKVLDTEVVVEEIFQFIKKHKEKEIRRNKITIESIKEDYEDMIEAVEDGFLVFDENKNPVYNLRHKIGEGLDDGSLATTQVKFRSRIKEADKNLLMDGLDMKRQIGTYTIKYISFITQLSMTEVKMLEKDDFEVLNQICSVF